MRNVTANLLSNVCNDVDIEPKLLPVTGQNLSNRTTNTRTEGGGGGGGGGVGGGFWVRGRQVFFNIRLFEPNAKRYPNSALSKCCAQNEKEEKKQ